jgi:hypothetical protein
LPKGGLKSARIWTAEDAIDFWHTTGLPRVGLRGSKTPGDGVT